MKRIDSQYKDLYRFILQNGLGQNDRTGVGTIAGLGGWMRFDLRDGLLPIISLRTIIPEKFILEMLWFVSGSQRIKFLKDNNVSVWDSWFIKGTDVYQKPDDVISTQIPFRNRVALAISEGLEQELYEFCDLGGLVREESQQNYAEVNVELCPSITGPWDLFQSEIDQIQTWLDKKGVGREIVEKAKPVSLKTRLSRVSKNDRDKWDAINAVLAEPWDKLNETHAGTGILAAGEPVKLTIYKDGKFQDVEVQGLVAHCVNLKLDELQVPAYKLIDADIGAGSYGPQWRKWQDTQLVSDLHDGPISSEYKARGYEWKGALWDDVTTQVFHREVDQLQNAIDLLKTDPDSRRIYVVSSNPGRAWQAALEPCHNYFQFVSAEMDLPELEREFSLSGVMDEYINEVQAKYGDPEGDPTIAELDALYLEKAKAFAAEHEIPTRWLSIYVQLRSWDVAAGGSFNTPQYAVLLNMVANVVGMAPREMFIIGVNAHIYNNQLEIIDDVMYTDSPEDRPTLHILRKVDSIDDFKLEDFEVTGYCPVKNTKPMPIAV